MLRDMAEKSTKCRGAGCGLAGRHVAIRRRVVGTDPGIHRVVSPVGAEMEKGVWCHEQEDQGRSRAP